MLGLLKRIGSSRHADAHVLGAYRVRVLEAAERLSRACDAWDGLRQIEPDNARLANMAAVNRWELVRLLRQLERLHVPSVVGKLHAELAAALHDAARAWQMLANGYRSHKSEAVCDGQALLVEAAAAVQVISHELETRWAAASEV